MGNSPKGENMLKKLNMCKIIGMGSLCLFLLGCSEESFLMQEKGAEVITEEISENMVKEENGFEQKESDDSKEQISSDEILSEEEKSADSQISAKEIAVHICGAVNQPGVYYLQENQRLYEAVAKAGGFRENADEDYLNQALVLEDGMKIVVPTKEETAGKREDSKAAGEENAFVVVEYIQNREESQNTALEQGYLQKKEENVAGNEKEQKVDLNTADEALLCTLPGIGESRAKSIIAYRQEHGPFERTEDVMNISGIKEAAYNKIKDYITVSK